MTPNLVLLVLGATLWAWVYYRSRAAVMLSRPDLLWMARLWPLLPVFYAMLYVRDWYRRQVWIARALQMRAILLEVRAFVDEAEQQEIDNLLVKLAAAIEHAGLDHDG